jgi:hypothetical protein
MNNSPKIPVEERKYVLRFPTRKSLHADTRWRYYTGAAPTYSLSKAKILSLSKAKATKQFAHTTRRCEVKRVTDKMLFKAALEGK